MVLGPYSPTIAGVAVDGNQITSYPFGHTDFRSQQIIDQAVRSTVRAEVDPLIYRSLLIGGEGAVIHIQRKGAFSREDRLRVRQLMQALVGSVLSNHASLPPVP